MTEPEFWRLVDDGRVTFGADGTGAPGLKLFLAEVQDGLVPRTWWPHQEVGHSQEGKREIQALFPELEPFATPKPERLLERVIHVGSSPGDIVLDAFGGSGTTAAVAHKMRRQWVLAEAQGSTVESFTAPRLKEVVAGTDPGGVTSVERFEGEGLPDGVKSGAARAAAAVLKKFSDAGALGELDGGRAGHNPESSQLSEGGRGGHDRDTMGRRRRLPGCDDGAVDLRCA